LAQPYPAGSRKTENGCVGTETYASAQRVYSAVCTEGADRQVAARTKIVEPIAFSQAIAPGEAVVGSALIVIQAGARSEAHVYAVRTEAPTRLRRTR
jgi:hypothetical protein